MSTDHRKTLGALYGARSAPQVVDVPRLAYLLIDGQGDPNLPGEYPRAVEALFSLAYAIRFAVKRAGGEDFRVMPLEGQWWCEDMRRFSVADKSNWSWTLMILQPDAVDATVVERCKAAVAARKDLPSLGKVRYAQVDEGRCAQVLHIGPFTEEGPTVERLHAFIEEQGGRLDGKHHEIYLSDIRRAAPARWRTIIRQPFSR